MGVTWNIDSDRIFRAINSVRSLHWLYQFAWLPEIPVASAPAVILDCGSCYQFRFRYRFLWEYLIRILHFFYIYVKTPVPSMVSISLSDLQLVPGTSLFTLLLYRLDKYKRSDCQRQLMQFPYFHDLENPRCMVRHMLGICFTWINFQ